MAAAAPRTIPRKFGPLGQFLSTGEVGIGIVSWDASLGCAGVREYQL